jgi:hypothetical protein
MTDYLKILSTVTRAYIAAAYFTDTGEPEQPDVNAELSLDAQFRAAETCADFLAQCSELLPEYPGSWDSFGHDLWLTRNRHGIGFWDRGHGAIGDKLTDIAYGMGSQTLVQGDDGFVYFECA